MTTQCTLMLLLFTCSGSTAQWAWANHGNPPVYTGMAMMKGGGTEKLFGVGNGILQERWWTGSAWAWANHGSPSGLFSTERLAARPCILRDGKVFIITNKGRLIERYWHAGNWHWTHHGKPAELSGFRSTTCACTTYANVDRVFMVGNDFKLYERFWLWATSSWQWRAHGSPPGTMIGPASIDTCNLPSCDTRVYVVGRNGNLYYRYITPANPGVASWVNLNKPSGESVRTVSVSTNGGGVFIVTYDNDICQYYVAWNAYHCFGKPPGSLSSPSTLISKAVHVTSCSKLSGTARYIFVNSWDPVYQKRSRIYSIRVSGINVNSWTYHGTIGSCCYYIGSPELYMSGVCPKAFLTRSNGYVYERYLP